MNTKNMRLGSVEMKLLFELESEGKRVFETGDAYRILGTSRDSVNTALYRLRRKGRIEPIERGRHLLIPARAGYNAKWTEMSLVLAARLVSPYYVGFSTALNHWDMTEQIPGITRIVTTRRKKRITHRPHRFEFVTVAGNRFFGAVRTTIDGEDVIMSSREKTIIDCLLHPRYCGGLDEAAKGIWMAWENLDMKKLFKYAGMMGVDVIWRRLLYILDILDLSDGNTDDALQSRSPKGYMLLDPTWACDNPEYSKKYGLILNRSRRSLTGWMGH